eukprot:s11089_g1.t1
MEKHALQGRRSMDLAAHGDYSTRRHSRAQRLLPGDVGGCMEKQVLDVRHYSRSPLVEWLLVWKAWPSMHPPTRICISHSAALGVCDKR